jgi:tetratricopeptide (TPR) repeat protein
LHKISYYGIVLVMQIMNLKKRQEFNKLYESGVRALNQRKPEIALNLFIEADELASHSNNDRRMRLNALNPLANSLWSMGEYEKAKQKLALASNIASDLALRDELAKAFSNFGRLEASKIIKEKPVTKQAAALRKIALPYFTKSYKMIDDHEYLYYRYANAKYGSIVAALAQDYKKASLLLTDGLSVAFKKARRLDKEVTYELDPTGLEHFAIASQLISLGSKNTNSRDYKKLEKIARDLIA